MKLLGQGEMHLRVALERLAARFGVTVEMRKPVVAYRETIRDAVRCAAATRNNPAATASLATSCSTCRPLARGEGFVFAETVHGGSVPRNYFPSVENGCRDALASAGRSAFRSSTSRATLTDGSYHSVDSSDMAFRAAAKLGMAEALQKARPVLLEPILCGGDQRAERSAVARLGHRFGAARPDPRL